MSKSILESFKSLDEGVKEALADLSSPLLLSFAAMDIAYQTCKVESLTAEHITACLEAAGVHLKKKSVIRALARAGDRVSPKETIDGETSYRLMTKGKRELPKLSGDSSFFVVRIEAGKPRMAGIKVSLVLAKLTGAIKICDPYYGIRSFDVLDAIPKVCPVKFLSAHATDKLSKLSGILSDFKKENPKFEIRVQPPPVTIHDRYLITTDQLLLLGNGFKDMGAKESFMINLEGSMAKDLIRELHNSFDKSWNSAQPV
jgi:hypothetical protein